jgi:hypothetical protein
MKSVQFSNKLYLGYVVLLLSYFLLNSSYLLFQSPSLIALLPWLIQMTVLILIVGKHKYVKYAIKGWSLFLIFGPGLQLLGQLLFLISDDQDKLAGFGKTIWQLVTFLFGLILFTFADRSIKNINEDTPSKVEDEAQ